MHTNSTLWKWHSVHHACERLYSINSGRFQALETIIITSFYYLPIVLFQVLDEVVILFYVATLVTGFLEHVNIDYRAGVFNYILNTATLHRWHHSIRVEESSNNFRKALIIWDIIFSTYYLPKNKEEEIGINNEVKVPNTLMGQLMYLFKS